jgi:hypothetical protein
LKSLQAHRDDPRLARLGIAGTSQLKKRIALTIKIAPRE